MPSSLWKMPLGSTEGPLTVRAGASFQSDPRNVGLHSLTQLRRICRECLEPLQG